MKTFIQFLWYSILNNIVKPNKPIPTNPVLGELKKMYFKIRFYMFFGLRVIWWGDSNVQKGDSFYVMRRFKLLTVNLGRGGSYAHHWLQAFKKITGKLLLRLMQSHINIINLGGNYILKGRMDIAYEGLKGIREKLPTSFWVNVPPIHSKIIAKLVEKIPGFPYKTAEEFNKQVDILNVYGKELWGWHVIDIHSVLNKEKNGIELWWFALADIVHYNDRAYRHLYVKIINAIITILQKARVIK